MPVLSLSICQNSGTSLWFCTSKTRLTSVPLTAEPNCSVVAVRLAVGPIAVPVTRSTASRLPPGVVKVNVSLENVPGIDGVNCTRTES